MAQFDRTFYGTTSDIELAKRSGYQGKFIDVSKYGDNSKYSDLLHAYKTGGNPVILGGAGATGGINDSIYQRLIQGGANVQRIGGKDRYEVQSNFGNYMRDLTKQKSAYDLEQMRKQANQTATNNVNKMYDQQKQAQLNQIRAERDKAIGGINQQKAQVKPQFQQARNQADVVNQQNVQRLRELMAANGLSATGENVSAQVSLNNERQNSLNTLNSQESQQLNEYNQRIADLKNPQQEQALIAAIEADRARALLDQQTRAEELAYQRSRDSVADDRYNREFNYNRGRDLVEDQRYQQEKAWREYTYRNMSSAEKAQLDWAKAQYGEDQAWKMFALKYQGELDKSMAQSELNFYKSGFNNVGGGGGYSNNYKTQQQASKSGSFKTYQTHLNQAIKMGVPAEWASALTELVGRESSWNSSAKNPKSTAHGYGQFLNSTRSNYEKKTGLNYSNPVHQLVMMAEYVKDRYGTPEKALAFWDKNKWY